MKILKFINSTFSILFLPYFNRLMTGEGGILIFAFIHIIFTQLATNKIIADCILSFFTLCILYGYNDFNDRKRDLLNPRKNQKFVILLNNNVKLFLVIHVIVLITILVVSYYNFGYIKTISLISLFIINFLYSNIFKSVPILDVCITSLWGGLIMFSFGVHDIYLAILVGLMTGIAHIYQTTTDNQVDQLTNIKTNSNTFKKAPDYLIIFITLTISILIYFLNINFLFPFSSLLLIFIYNSKFPNQIKWNLSRLYFLISFLVIKFKLLI